MILGTVFLLGLLVGSFLNVCIDDEVFRHPGIIDVMDLAVPGERQSCGR